MPESTETLGAHFVSCQKHRKRGPMETKAEALAMAVTVARRIAA